MKRFVKILISCITYGKMITDNEQKEGEIMTHIERWETQTVSALSLAKYAINIANKNGKTITNLKLQKILYYLQGLFYRKYCRRLFWDIIEAWNLGPVVPEVYFYYKSFGSDPITDSGSIESLPLSVGEINFINSVILDKVSYSSYYLVDATHKEEPWKIASGEGKDVGFHKEIPFNTIASYFSNAGC